MENIKRWSCQLQLIKFFSLVLDFRQLLKSRWLRWWSVNSAGNVWLQSIISWSMTQSLSVVCFEIKDKEELCLKVCCITIARPVSWCFAVVAVRLLFYSFRYTELEWLIFDQCYWENTRLQCFEIINKSQDAGWLRNDAGTDKSASRGAQIRRKLKLHLKTIL